MPQNTNEKFCSKGSLLDSFLTKNSQKKQGVTNSKNKQCDQILEKIDQEIEKMNAIKLSSSQYSSSINGKKDQNYKSTANKTLIESNSTESNLSLFRSKSRKHSISNKKFMFENEVGRQMLRSKKNETNKEENARDSSISSRSLSKIKGFFSGMIDFLACTDK